MNTSGYVQEIKPTTKTVSDKEEELKAFGDEKLPEPVKKRGPIIISSKPVSPFDWIDAETVFISRVINGEEKKIMLYNGKRAGARKLAQDLQELICG